MSPAKLPRAEVVELYKRSAESFARVIFRLLKARTMQAFGKGTGEEVRRARDAVGRNIARTMALSDLLGRRRALLEMDAAKGGAFDVTPQQALVPDVTFAEAVEDIIRREPRLARSAEAVSRLYSTEHAAAFAFSTDIEVTKRIQRAISQAARLGVPEDSATKVIERLTEWPKGYARTVYRTNLNTAYTAGRFQEAADPDIADVMPAFEYMAVLDANTRDGGQDEDENHRAGHGLIAATSDPVWDFASPPSGYNCRCTIRLVSRFELEDRGLIRNGSVVRFEPGDFRNFRPHRNFGRGRPDRRLYGLAQFSGRGWKQRVLRMWSAEG